MAVNAYAAGSDQLARHLATAAVRGLESAMKPSLAELNALVAVSRRRLLELHQEIRDTERQLEDTLRLLAEHHSTPIETPQEPELDT